MASLRAATNTGIGNGHTVTWNDNGHYSVRLYKTVIYDEAFGKIALDNGGWVTQTTARRMNQILLYRGQPASVRIRQGVMMFGSNPFVNGRLTIARIEVA